MDEKPISETATEAGIAITPEMLRAGVCAYERWNAEEEEKEALVAEIFYSMIDAAPPLRRR